MLTIQDLNKYSGRLPSVTHHTFEGWISSSMLVTVELMDNNPMLYCPHISVGDIIDNEQFIKHIVVRDYMIPRGENYISLQEYQED